MAFELLTAESITCAGDAGCDDCHVCTFYERSAGACSHTPNKYADVDFNRTVNIFDLFCVLDGCGGLFSGNCTFERLDIEPCAGNGTINIFDLLAVQGAFVGVDPCCGGLP